MLRCLPNTIPHAIDESAQADFVALARRRGFNRTPPPPSPATPRPTTLLRSRFSLRVTNPEVNASGGQRIQQRLASEIVIVRVADEDLAIARHSDTPCAWSGGLFAVVLWLAFQRDSHIIAHLPPVGRRQRTTERHFRYRFAPCIFCCVQYTGRVCGAQKMERDDGPMDAIHALFLGEDVGKDETYTASLNGHNGADSHRHDPQHTGLPALREWLLTTDALSQATTIGLASLTAERLAHAQALIAETPHSAPTREQAEALRSYVERGGGLLLLGATADCWRDAHDGAGDILGALIGLPTNNTPQRTIPTELILKVAADSDITRRIDGQIVVQGTVSLLDTLPPDAQPLLTTSWRYTRVPVAYMRHVGKGYVFVCTLASDVETGDPQAHPAMRQILFRAMRYAAGWREGAPLGVALIGFGAIGREHGDAIERTHGLTLAAVCDRNPARITAAQERFPSVRGVSELDDILADETIQVAIVGTPPNTHAALARQLLLAGKHVVVEKPFCLTTAEADDLIRLAEERVLTLTVYQNRRWDADFLAIQEVVRAGTIGEVFHVETFIGGYGHPCDFWHSHEPISGGVFYDWGSHYLDWILTLLPGEVTAVRASVHKRVWQDVTNADQATLHLRFADGREASFIHSDVAALLKPKWYILGERGAIIADWRHETVATRKWTGDLIEERLAPSEAPPIVTVATRGADGRINEQRLALPDPLHEPFHRNLANHLLAGEPLAVQPRSSRRNIAVMEAAVRSAAHDAEIVRPAPARVENADTKAERNGHAASNGNGNGKRLTQVRAGRSARNGARRE